jgi:hypothetical protein
MYAPVNQGYGRAFANVTSDSYASPLRIVFLASATRFSTVIDPDKIRRRTPQDADHGAGVDL